MKMTGRLWMLLSCLVAVVSVSILCPVMEKEQDESNRWLEGRAAYWQYKMDQKRFDYEPLPTQEDLNTGFGSDLG